jgi:hypothetical protein
MKTLDKPSKLSYLVASEEILVFNGLFVSLDDGERTSEFAFLHLNGEFGKLPRK